jgi:hypothetical protein
MDKYETCDKIVYAKKEEEKTNFSLQLQRFLTFFTGLIISSLIFGFFGIAIGGLIGGSSGATFGVAIGLILAAGFSFLMLSNKNSRG